VVRLGLHDNQLVFSNKDWLLYTTHHMVGDVLMELLGLI
jgi:hypothetical protein